MKKVLARLTVVIAGYLLGCSVLLVVYRTFDPPVTGLQAQRCVQAWWAGQSCRRRAQPVPLRAISPRLLRAVVAAEDGRFLSHGGVDWRAVERAMKANRRAGRVKRGGSTITQQLVKNLFMTDHRSWLRKGFEVPLAWAAEGILGKRRILELYLNVVEWGDGVWGAQAAARHHFGVDARRLTRRQAAGLATILPSPRRRNPRRMKRYTAVLIRRMRRMRRHRAMRHLLRG